MSLPPIPVLPNPNRVVACPVCQTANTPLARFCLSCGTRLLFFCWSCGAAAQIGQPYCQACGTRLAPAGEPDGQAQLVPSITADAPALAGPAVFVPRPFVPPSTLQAEPTVTTLLSAPDAAPSSPGAAEDDAQLIEERRLVSVLFADIVGFTTVSERLDPEDVRELSASVLARLAEAVAEYGGTIDKFMGDAVMALFGAPVAHEDDAARAVRAALAMHQAMAALMPLDRDGNELEIRVRIGINSGEVIAGARDVGGHREYTVFGDVVNTAARLQTAAEPGSILLGEETARQTAAVFDLVPIEPLALKGKAEPVPAYKVRGTPTRDAPVMESPGSGRPLPLVGRLLEVRELRQHLQELSRGRGQIITVIGEHGVGKTRLLNEVRQHADELGIRWVESSAPSHAQNLSYRLAREALYRLLDLLPGLPEASLVEELHRKLDPHGLGGLVPTLAFALGTEEEDSFVAGLTAQQVQWKVVEAVRRVTLALTRERPLIQVLDAMQWSDPSSIEIMSALMSLTDEAPVLWIYVFTPDPDAPSWQLKEQAARSFPHRYTEINLGPLPERAARELMCSLLSCAETPAQIEELVLERTDGNPFFIEEVLRALIESGALRKDGERWVADSDVRDLQIPNTLLATVMARIDRLAPGVRRTLQVAAVIGPEFSERVLRRVVDGSPDLDRHLREALRAGLIREETLIPERRYAFTQTLLREAAAGSLLLRRRREIHVQVGWALEEVYADSLEDQYGELGRHFWEGEVYERAFRYSRLAAEQAAAAFANDEAVASFTIALESARRSAAGAAPQVVAALSERRGDIRGLIGDYALALEDYEQALDYHLEELQDAGEGSPTRRAEAAHVGTLALKIARLRSYLGQVFETRQALQLAFEHLPPDSPVLSSAYSLKTILHVWATDTDAAAEAGRKALELARQHGGSFQRLSEAYEALTHPALLGALGGELAALADEWVALARAQPEDRSGLLKALVARGFVQTWALWSFDEPTRADVQEALELARATGSVAAEHTARGILGAGQLLLGEWREAEAALRSSAGQVISLAGAGAINEWWLMLLLSLKGDLESTAEQMRTWLEDANNTHRQVTMRALYGLNRFLAGEHDAAREAMVLAREADSKLECAQCAVAMDTLAAEVMAALGEREPARLHAARAREAGISFERWSAALAADRADAILALQHGDHETARRLLEGAVSRAVSLGQPFELARSLDLLADARDAAGKHGAASAQWERALEIYERLGAQPCAQQIRSKLGRPLQV